MRAPKLVLVYTTPPHQTKVTNTTTQDNEFLNGKTSYNKISVRSAIASLHAWFYGDKRIQYNFLGIQFSEFFWIALKVIQRSSQSSPDTFLQFFCCMFAKDFGRLVYHSFSLHITFTPFIENELRRNQLGPIRINDWSRTWTVRTWLVPRNILTHYWPSTYSILYISWFLFRGR